MKPPSLIMLDILCYAILEPGGGIIAPWCFAPSHHKPNTVTHPLIGLAHMKSISVVAGMSSLHTSNDRISVWRISVQDPDSDPETWSS